MEGWREKRKVLEDGEGEELLERGREGTSELRRFVLRFLQTYTLLT